MFGRASCPSTRYAPSGLSHPRPAVGGPPTHIAVGGMPLEGHWLCRHSKREMEVFKN